MARARKRLSFQYQAPDDPAFYSAGKGLFAAGCIVLLIGGALFVVAWVIIATALRPVTP